MIVAQRNCNEADEHCKSHNLETKCDVMQQRHQYIRYCTS
jgi:hypothetical protein